MAAACRSASLIRWLMPSFCLIRASLAHADFSPADVRTISLFSYGSLLAVSDLFALCLLVLPSSARHRCRLPKERGQRGDIMPAA